MTNEGNSNDGMMHDQLESEVESEDVDKEESVKIPEAWIVYPMVYPNMHSNYKSRRNQWEWEVTRHDHCRSNLREVTWNWMERSSEILCGDSIRVTDPTHPAFDYCGEVLEYNAGTHESNVQLSEAVEGRRVGIIHRTMITKIHRTTNNTVGRSPIAVRNNLYLDDFIHEANLELEP